MIATIIKTILAIIIFPVGIFLFETWYFRDAMNKPGAWAAIIFFSSVFFVICAIILIFHLPYVSNKRYYKLMNWDAKTIARYEEDMKNHDAEMSK